MKELSIEEKAKRYDEALEAVKSLREVNPSDEGIQNWVNENFPELAESEDERIKKEIVSAINIYCSEYLRGTKVRNDMLAWLEKHGEQSNWKPSKDEMDALYGLAYITNKMDDKKDEAITKLYQDLKREFFNEASYENMFPSSPVDSDINVEKQGEQKHNDE